MKAANFPHLSLSPVKRGARTICPSVSCPAPTVPPLCSFPPRTGYFHSSASPGEKNISRILIPVSTVLCPLTLVAFGLLQKKLRTKETSECSWSSPEAGEGVFVLLRHSQDWVAVGAKTFGEGNAKF